MKNIVNNIYDEISEINLDSLFGNDKEEELKEIKEEETKDVEVDKKEEKKINPEDCLYDRTMTCPVCESEFKTRTVRKGKSKFLGSDMDLRSNYEPINPDYYDVILCDKCGYAAISINFNHIGERQSRLIADNISIRFVPKEYPKVFDVDTAIERYKIALLNAVTKNGKAGEKAYICLKLGWFYREKKDIDNEIKYLKSAIEGFNTAFTNENFPICGLDEYTLLYIMAALNFRLGDTEECKRILSRLIIKRGLPERLKINAEDLREMIKKQEKLNQ